MTGVPFDAVVLDLDDTLFLQSEWLAGAWQAVAAAAQGLGGDAGSLHAALVSIGAKGSDKGTIIDRALLCSGQAHLPVAPLVTAFQSWRPVTLTPDPAVTRLVELRGLGPVGLLTDGDPGIQRGKLAALGLTDAFDAVVVTDELGGRAARKPAPDGFRALLRAMGADSGRSLMIGDRPDKDVAGASNVGMRAVRVRTGEYADHADSAWHSVSTLDEAISIACGGQPD